MISISGSLSFVKMSSVPAKSVGHARFASQDPFIHCPIQSLLQSVLEVRSFYIERNYFVNQSFSFDMVQGENQP